MISLIRLRKKEPTLERPFRVPFYPVVPMVALAIAFVSLVALALFNVKLGLIYLGLVGLCYGIFKLWNLRNPGE
jgi:ethanolamine permease